MEQQTVNDNKELVESIPDEVMAEIEGIIETGEEIRLAVASDMIVDGTYGTSWLVATDRRLAAFSTDGVPTSALVHIHLVDIDSVETRDLYGNNLLKIRTADRGIEIMRYSKSLSHKMARVIPELQSLISKSRPD